MNKADQLNSLFRKIIRRLNWIGLFIERGYQPYPIVVLAGYTRSGTTFLGQVLANILGCRSIHEPLNPHKVDEISFFNERESIVPLRAEPRYRDALKSVFSPGFRGNRDTNTGTQVIYTGRLVKIVRGNHYLDYLTELLPGQKFVFIMRNPFACVASRLRLGWPAPDLSHCIDDMWPLLSTTQKKCYEETESPAGKIAVTWCIDNMMALRNADNALFHFVHYEELMLHPRITLEAILDHTGRDIKPATLLREIRREEINNNASIQLKSWLKHISDGDKQSISNVLDIFNMNGFYSESTTLPIGKAPFKAHNN